MLGQRLGLHRETISKVVKYVTEGNLSDLATRILTSKRALRVDRIDFDESGLKVLALHWTISNTRDSPDPDDQIPVRIFDRKLFVACRYLNVNRGEAYFNFIRDISRTFKSQNPDKQVSDHMFVGETLFKKWLREWKFIKTEEWYVCICALCYNMNQYVTVDARLIRRIHGQTKPLVTLPPVPVRVKLSADDIDCDTDQESDGGEDVESNMPAECVTVQTCMAAPFRQRSTAQVPMSNRMHTYATCYASPHRIRMNDFVCCADMSARRPPFRGSMLPA